MNCDSMSEYLPNVEPGVAQGAGMLDSISRDTPAFPQALEISKRAVAAGFEWSNEEGVWAKVAEEIAEFREAQTPAEKELEFGDILFSLVNVARWNGIDPEAALLATCEKFRYRWGHMERTAATTGRELDGMSAGELMDLWKGAKCVECEKRDECDRPRNKRVRR